MLFSWLSVGQVEMELSQLQGTTLRLRLKCDGTHAEIQISSLGETDESI